MVFDLLKSYLKSCQLFVSLTMQDSSMKIVIAWSCAKHWAQWWTRCDHLKMLSKPFSMMEDSIWERCPSSTNTFERRNRDCKSA